MPAGPYELFSFEATTGFDLTDAAQMPEASGTQPQSLRPKVAATLT